MINHPYPVYVEVQMQRHFSRLSEKDRRSYVAVEACKLGHGSIEYLSTLFKIDPKTIRRGLTELALENDPAPGRVRKKGAETKT